MAEEKKSPAEQVLDQLKDPWDWTAAVVGAAGGAVATIFLHGADLGHSVPAGALSAVAARRSVATSFSRRTLRKRAYSLLEILRVDEKSNSPSIAELSDWIAKWEKKVVPNDFLEKKLAAIAETDNKRKIDKARRDQIVRGAEAFGEQGRPIAGRAPSGAGLVDEL